MFHFRRRNFKTTNETNLSLILLSIVAVFLFCHFPRLLLNMAEFIGNDLEEPDVNLIKLVHLGNYDKHKKLIIQVPEDSGIISMVRMSHGVSWYKKYTFFRNTSEIFFRFSHLLLMVNGSVNFLIYCSLNSSFKAELRQSFWRIFGRNNILSEVCTLSIFKLN